MEGHSSYHDAEQSQPFVSNTAAEMLNEAARNGSIETIRQLLDEGTDINSKVNSGWTALHSAVKRNREDIVRLLLDRGADPHARLLNGTTPFVIAGERGNVNLLQLLLDKGSDVNEHDSNGFTAFLEAAWYRNLPAVRFLHEKGADVNFCRVVNEEKRKFGKGGQTALMYAARNGDDTMVKALLDEMGAALNICDNRGRNAFVHVFMDRKDWPWGEEKEKLALFLLNRGADVTGKNEYGKTTLILAVERRSPVLVRAILEKGDVDINAKDNRQKTALKAAVLRNNREIARLLCENGAAIENNLEIAQKHFFDGMMALLRQFGATPCLSPPQKTYASVSKRWGCKLQDLCRWRGMPLGKLSKFCLEASYKIRGTSERGGVYLGIYDETEVAVKVFPIDAENAKQEKACFEKCRTSNHLVKLYGWEEWKACLYLCLALCEMNLEEYFETEEKGPLKSQEILKTIFQAVEELHGFGFGHQDLHPSNILIDIAGKVFLADFDKSTKLGGNNDEKDAIIKEDLKALEKLIVYVAMRGRVSFEDLPSQCPADVEDQLEIEDLRASLSNLDERIPVSKHLRFLLSHPYFWSKQT
ncbi:2-5A-dependent ribonuclease [Varanus komodoensis]|nr:2-5A-dependent ribonuclease [Varanus komodoensis]